MLRWLAEDVYAEAEKVVLVMGDSSAHERAGRYDAFEPEPARRRAARFEAHHTPEHGSRLNVAEVERSALARQCLDRRIESTEELRKGREPRSEGRNDRGIGANGPFTTANARIELRRLDPAVQNSRSPSPRSIPSPGWAGARWNGCRARSGCGTRCTCAPTSG